MVQRYLSIPIKLNKLFQYKSLEVQASITSETSGALLGEVPLERSSSNTENTLNGIDERIS